jgi:hypothetical protein
MNERKEDCRESRRGRINEREKGTNNENSKEWSKYFNNIIGSS